MEPSTPRRSSRRNSFSSRSSSHNKENKNPYSMSGLDKFSALLAELEEKKQKIYSQVNNPDEISLVRFVFKDSNDCVPIVIKMKKQDKNQQQQQLQENINIKQNLPRNQDSDQIKDKFPLESPNSASNNNNKRWSWSFSFAWNDLMKLSNWRRPCYYLPAIIVLILLFLVLFGRSFAILCTSIGWYIVPTLNSKAAETNPNPIRRSMKKKQYLRFYSDNKMVTAAAASRTTANNHSGTLKKLGHQKSL